MNTFSRPKDEPTVQAAVNQVLSNMEQTQPGTDEYTAMVDNLAKLTKAQNEAKQAKSEWRVKPDTIALIAANLIGIVLVMHYEKAEVITTKAIGFVPKMLK